MDPDAVVAAADLVLLTVPDDSIRAVTTGLAALGAWRPGQIVMHTCGRYGTEVLSAAASAGVLPLAIHPAMTFTGTSLDVDRLAGTAFAVSGAPTVLPIAQALVVEMGGEPWVIADADRPAYQAALVQGAGHVATLIGQAVRRLADVGVADPAAVLGPLAHASVDAALASPFGASSMTGAVVVGGADTVAAHLHALIDQPDALATYRVLARATADAALADGLLAPASFADIVAALGADP